MNSSELTNSNFKSKICDDATIFASSLMELVHREDISSMVYIQRDMLSRFEKTNEMLINFNILSASRYEATVKDFQKHTQLLFEMKKDLDTVFKRIRVLKQRLEKSYPEAFAACSSIYTPVSDSDDDDDDSDGGETSIPVVVPPTQTTLPDPPVVTITDIATPPTDHAPSH